MPPKLRNDYEGRSKPLMRTQAKPDGLRHVGSFRVGETVSADEASRGVAHLAVAKTVEQPALSPASFGYVPPEVMRSAPAVDPGASVQ